MDENAVVGQLACWLMQRSKPYRGASTCPYLSKTQGTLGPPRFPLLFIVMVVSFGSLQSSLASHSQLVPVFLTGPLQPPDFDASFSSLIPWVSASGTFPSGSLP